MLKSVLDEEEPGDEEEDESIEAGLEMIGDDTDAMHKEEKVSAEAEDDDPGSWWRRIRLHSGRA